MSDRIDIFSSVISTQLMDFQRRLREAAEEVESESSEIAQLNQGLMRVMKAQQESCIETARRTKTYFSFAFVIVSWENAFLEEMLKKREIHVELMDEKSHRTLLHVAAREGNAEAAEILITHGANVNAQTIAFQKTPLHEAAEKGHVLVVRELLKAHPDVNATNSFGQTPLHFAASKGHVEVIRALLEANRSS